MTDTELLSKIYWLTYSMHADEPLDHMQVIQAIRKLILEHSDVDVKISLPDIR